MKSEVTSVWSLFTLPVQTSPIFILEGHSYAKILICFFCFLISHYFAASGIFLSRLLPP